MYFKDYLKSHGVGEEFLSPDGLLARLNADKNALFPESFFEPFEAALRHASKRVPVDQIIQPGLLVKFSEQFKSQTYVSEPRGLLILLSYIIKLADFIFRTNIAKQPVFYGYIEGNSGSKTNPQFPFEEFLEVTAVDSHWGQYKEQDGTLWQISHIPLCDISWVEVLPKHMDKELETLYGGSKIVSLLIYPNELPKVRYEVRGPLHLYSNLLSEPRNITGGLEGTFYYDIDGEASSPSIWKGYKAEIWVNHLGIIDPDPEESLGDGWCHQKELRLYLRVKPQIARDILDKIFYFTELKNLKDKKYGLRFELVDLKREVDHPEGTINFRILGFSSW